VLTCAIFIPRERLVADRFGARHRFPNAIAVFTLGSILCGFCNDVAELTAARRASGLAAR